MMVPPSLESMSKSAVKMPAHHQNLSSNLGGEQGFSLWGPQHGHRHGLQIAKQSLAQESFPMLTCIFCKDCWNACSVVDTHIQGFKMAQNGYF